VERPEDFSMDKARVTELGYLGLGVSDLGAWRDFATEILGMEFLDDDSGARLRMDYWRQRIVLHQGADDDLRYMGFRLSGPEAFGAMQRQLTEVGAKFEVASAAEAEDHHVLEMLRLEDPAGVPIELFHGPQVDLHVPFRPGRGMHGRFLTGDQGLGHVIIRDRGIAESERFYREVLGMRGGVEGRLQIGDQRVDMVFMHCNARGHTVGVGVPGWTKRIQHFMVEVDNLDDVGLAYDLVRQRQIPILMGLGRHGNDKMVSFYMQTPSGFFCEYGWGGGHSFAQSEYNPRGNIWGLDAESPSLRG
jgi:2,3-dihydroxybiphenyl 1,2-dioxygenase